MNINNIKYPITVIAPDGWVGHFTKNEEISSWNKLVVKKYAKIGFHVLCGENHAWVLSKIEKAEEIKFTKRLLSIFSMRQVTFKTEITVNKCESPSLETIREAFLAALLKDDDILTQWNDQEKIKKEIVSLSEIEDFVPMLKKLKVI